MPATTSNRVNTPGVEKGNDMMDAPINADSLPVKWHDDLVFISHLSSGTVTSATGHVPVPHLWFHNSLLIETGVATTLTFSPHSTLLFVLLEKVFGQPQ